MALEATLHRLYQETLDSAEKSPLLADVRQFIEREQKHFVEAESQLQQLLTRQPTNLPATLLLARLYTLRICRQPDKALALLQPSDKPLPLPRQFLNLARQSVNEWSNMATKHAQMERRSQQDSLHAQPQPEPAVREISIDELLKCGQLATAIEHLEKSIAERPAAGC